MFYGAAMNN